MARVEVVRGRLEGVSETKVTLSVPSGSGGWVEKDFPRGELEMDLGWLFSHLGQWVQVRLEDGIARSVTE